MGASHQLPEAMLDEVAKTLFQAEDGILHAAQRIFEIDAPCTIAPSPFGPSEVEFSGPAGAGIDEAIRRATS